MAYRRRGYRRPRKVYRRGRSRRRGYPVRRRRLATRIGNRW